ncbi:MAG: hypothetical protein B7Y12_10745 [Rhizobiales bacterium 24-66-13]|nr:MAG: hypothetical protein B7Y61_09460 [Rhizobiales bacterium 35-66-30]OYZ77183.1 MAG: hypothetical protein B7Y12_10745 [Rhizobiales bacterium 24-66-13]OZB07210.1 MAG: hypothetical protein B7X67_09140 [Rhizobiales bacterium 39-66-18]
MQRLVGRRTRKASHSGVFIHRRRAIAGRQLSRSEQAGEQGANGTGANRRTAADRALFRRSPAALSRYGERRHAQPTAAGRLTCRRKARRKARRA